MQGTSYIIALIGALVLLASGAIWWNVFFQPEPELAAGRLEQYARRANWAAIATMAAFGLSAVAAILAIIGSVF
jgi:hypothetical protein